MQIDLFSYSPLPSNNKTKTKGNKYIEFLPIPQDFQSN